MYGDLNIHSATMEWQGKLQAAFALVHTDINEQERVIAAFALNGEQIISKLLEPEEFVLTADTEYLIDARPEGLGYAGLTVEKEIPTHSTLNSSTTLLIWAKVLDQAIQLAQLASQLQKSEAKDVANDFARLLLETIGVHTDRNKSDPRNRSDLLQALKMNKEKDLPLYSFSRLARGAQDVGLPSALAAAFDAHKNAGGMEAELPKSLQHIVGIDDFAHAKYLGQESKPALEAA